MYKSFLHIAGLLNEQLSVTPLLYGSLGLERRLSADMNADDIDVLIPEKCLHDGWHRLVSLMEADGYCLIDEHEHEFRKGDVSVAYASLEDLTPFAGVDISALPVTEDAGVRFLLLDLPDYLKVYTASSKDGYRKDVKNKQDSAKIALIRKALEDEGRA